MRNSIRRSCGTSALRSRIPRWTVAAQATAFTTLGNSARNPSPVCFTMRPSYSAILASISSAAVRFPCGMRACLVQAHEPAIGHNICGEDGRQTSLHRRIVHMTSSVLARPRDARIRSPVRPYSSASSMSLLLAGTMPPLDVVWEARQRGTGVPVMRPSLVPPAAPETADRAPLQYLPSLRPGTTPPASRRPPRSRQPSPVRARARYCYPA